MSVVDSETKEVVRTIDVGQRPRGITVSHDGKFIYLCASDDDTIEIIDTSTYEIVGSLPSGPDPELFVLSPVEPLDQAFVRAPDRRHQPLQAILQ